MAKKKRGRPLKAETLESLATKEALLNRPTWTMSPSGSSASNLKELIDSMNIAEAQIIQQYKYSHTTSVKHAYAMASVGDEVMEEFAETLLKRDKEKREESSINKKSGGDAVKRVAINRANNLCLINKVLLERLKPIGPLSMSDVARIILRDWEKLDPASLLPGEQPNMKRRGLPGKAPTAKTICSYIKLASPFQPHRVGKTSLRNK